MRAFAAVSLAIAILLSTPVRADVAPAKIGQRVESFSLRDFHGQPYALDEAASGKIVVLAFLGTECPLARLYAPRLQELAEHYGGRGVTFVGINSNRQDSVTEIAAFARTHNIGFLILKDLNQKVADQVGATRTPEIVVLDAERRIRYRGRIDNQYGFQANSSYHKASPSERNLADALEALLADKPIEVAETKAPGCLIGRDREAQTDSEVTYSKQVARILNAKCVSCHREGQIAPFALTKYDEVAGWADMIAEVVETQRMPPWHANPLYGNFKHDARLSNDEKATLTKWVAAGAPEGDPQDLPEPPKFAEGWMMTEPDQVLYMSEKPFDVPATGVVDYQMFYVDPGWKEDKWIREVEIRPGNSAVVHHIMLLILPPDGNLTGGIGSGNDFLWAFAPGIQPDPLPEGLARFVPAGSKLIFQVHYTPNGSPQQDRSYCGFKFIDAKDVKREVRVNSALNFVFQIPPGDSAFPVRSRYVFRDDSLLLTFMPHMHLRGKSFRYEATYPDGTTEILLEVPRYDAGWQILYRLAEPKRMPKGTRIDCYAQFDNSADNLNNPNPNEPVRFGDQMWQEMMIGFFEVTSANEDRSRPETLARSSTRIDDFNTILAATKGEPDDNIKVGAYMSLLDPGIFAQFGLVLRTMAPQIDRVCVTAVQDGQVNELFGPLSSAAKASTQTGKEVLNVSAAMKNQESILSPLPPVSVQGESLASYAGESKVVVHNDLSQVEGKLFETMRKRGAKSSMHVPADLNGQRVTVNFWSADAGAFTPPAEALLTALAQVMTAPKTPPPAAN